MFSQFYCSLCLVLLKSHENLVTASLSYVLKSVIVMPSAVLFAQDCVVVWALVCLHLCFRNVCPRSGKNPLDDLMGFVLNLYHFVRVSS